MGFRSFSRIRHWSMVNSHLTAPIPLRERPKVEEPAEEIMAKKDLNGKKVAILVDEGFEQVELIKPRKALDKAGAQTQVVSPKESEVRGWNIKRWGKSVAV